MVSGTGPAPNQADTVAFWRGLWSEPINHSEGPWTEVVASQCASITPMDHVIITPDDVAEAVRRAPNWKSLGLDGLHHYWLKGFVVCHTVLARQFQEALNKKSLPSLFTTGITHLVPKDQCRASAKIKGAKARLCTWAHHEMAPGLGVSRPPLWMMEYGETRNGPLPGGHQGASGAGAGRDSMRTASRARGAARPSISPSYPSSSPADLVSAGSSRAQQSAPATGGVRRMRWTIEMNTNALRAYFRAKGGEVGGLAYRVRMHCLFAELEPSLTVTEQNLPDRVRYLLRSNIFDIAELERLRREAVPSLDENATAEDAAPQIAEQPANVDAAVNTPVVVDSKDDGKVAQELELEHMKSTLEEAIVETRSTPLENRPRLPRIALSKRNRAVVRALNPMLVTYLEASLTFVRRTQFFLAQYWQYSVL
ncbi:unnamed protein product [Parnassius apollo]|uniref:(apollo) hypothetical protein n=1 Tax=Parnassius apollo TaxID=110799 RepID=A0A8S3WGT9_PARAO|nr:unnamed protein product [Parnassius apollo]